MTLYPEKKLELIWDNENITIGLTEMPSRYLRTLSLRRRRRRRRRLRRRRRKAKL